jgi:hypothetical protein
MVEGGTVYMAGDSGQFSGWDVTALPGGKVYEKGGCLFGSAGYARFRQLIQHHLVVPFKGDLGLDEWAVTKLVPAMRALLKDHGHATVTNAMESHESVLLVGAEGRLLKVGGDYTVTEATPYGAVGCGQDFALGVLYATADKGAEPFDRLRLALEAAGHFSAGVREPYTFLKLDAPA